MIRSSLRRSYIAIEPFSCPICQTGKAWDKGYCLGYVIYALPGDLTYLKIREDILYRVAHSLSRFLYAPDDARPYQVVNVVSQARMMNVHPMNQALFLEHCLQLDSSQSKVL